jgi:hypothetical protein
VYIVCKKRASVTGGKRRGPVPTVMNLLSILEVCD